MSNSIYTEQARRDKIDARERAREAAELRTIRQEQLSEQLLDDDRATYADGVETMSGQA